MTQDEFMRRFLLSPLSKALEATQLPLTATTVPLKPAAVLVLFYVPAQPQKNAKNQLQLILTKRAQHLKHHPGQISFPGGRVEPSDSSPIATALRETQEEIGIPAEQVTIVGTLPSYQTMTNFQVTPVVGILNQPPKYVIDNSEVAHIIEVPIAHFIRQEQQHNFQQLESFYQGRKRTVHFLPFEEHLIWGATAAILHDLSVHLINCQ